PARPAGPRAAAVPARRAAAARGGDRRSDLGGAPAGALRPAPLAPAPGPQHRAAAAAPARVGHPPPAPARTRASQRSASGAADRTDAADPVAAAPRPDPARAGRAPRRARLSGHLLHRQAQGGGEGL